MENKEKLVVKQLKIFDYDDSYVYADIGAYIENIYIREKDKDGKYIETEENLLDRLQQLQDKIDSNSKRIDDLGNNFNAVLDSINKANEIIKDLGNLPERVSDLEDKTESLENLSKAFTDDLDSKDLKGLAKYILELENPIGHIRMETDGTNPRTRLGFGTWVLWGQGRVPVGVNTADSDFSTIEKTGGTKTVTLTKAQMPSHTHTFTGKAHRHGGVVTSVSVSTSGNFDRTFVNVGVDNVYSNSGSTQNATVEGTNSTEGNGEAHTNLQPYITCYMWKRTA